MSKSKDDRVGRALRSPRRIPLTDKPGPSHEEIDASRIKAGLPPLYSGTPTPEQFYSRYEPEARQVFPSYGAETPLRQTSVADGVTIPPFQPRMGYMTTEPELKANYTITEEMARRGYVPVETSEGHAVVPARAELLREAETLITGERNESYGTPTQNFDNIAGLWNVQFGHMLKDGQRFTGAHVAQAMSHVKLARMVAQPKRDNWLDLAGYAACGWEAQEAEQ